MLAAPRLYPCLTRVEEEGEELPAHLLPLGDHTDPIQQRLITVRNHTILEGVDDRRPPWSIGVIGERAVNHQWMMERGFSLFQLDHRRLFETLELLRCEDLSNRLHVASQARDRQQIPLVASRHVVQATVGSRGFIQSDPAGQMGHRLCPGPVRVVLVPGDNATMPGRLAEELVMPEADGSAQELAGRHGEARLPQDVVKPWRNPPGTQ